PGTGLRRLPWPDRTIRRRALRSRQRGRRTVLLDQYARTDRGGARSNLQPGETLPRDALRLPRGLCGASGVDRRDRTATARWAHVGGRVAAPDPGGRHCGTPVHLAPDPPGCVATLALGGAASRRWRILVLAP